ncbi:hypothetical protein PybrP1_009219 [[Pythium] brassicae (nom. inval.)]|nr:hypothetical protein PybrP1_009219 [[Pythium] brassicae (nom. inval.)]
MYFYNALTGESVWELPPEEEEEEEEGEVGKPSSMAQRSEASDAMKPDISAVGIAIEVADAMLDMLEMVDKRSGNAGADQKKQKKKFVSPAAVARAKRNELNDAKRRKRVRAKAARAYLQIALSHTESSAVGSAATVRNAALNERTAPRQGVGALFSLEDTTRWRLEREVARIKQRRVVRTDRLAHQHHVLLLKRQRAMRQRFRTALTTHFVRQVECSSELLKQRILLLSSPQQRAALEATRNASIEPEIAERFAKEQQDASTRRVNNIEKAFVLIDEGAQGTLHVLQILFGIFTLERVQQYAMHVRGLAELICSQELQTFVVDFVASAAAHDAFTVTMAEFVDFVAIIEDALDHSASLRAAVKEAEDEIDASLEAAVSAPGVSRLRARVGIVSKKKVEQEIVALKATEEQVRLRRELERQAAFRSDDGGALHALKEEWEKNHHHRFIRFSATLPLYCCLCRRRKWDRERREHEEAESAHRSHWAARYALKVKEEELKLVEGDSALQPPPEPIELLPATAPPKTLESRETPSTRNTVGARGFDLNDEDELAVLQVVRSLVALTERVGSATPASESPKRTRPTNAERSGVRQPARALKKSAKDRKHKASLGSSEADARLQRAMTIFESEESERKAMHAEEVRMQLLLERGRRAMERPLLQVQDAAYNAYIRTLTHIVNPCSFLYRLEFARCLARLSPQQSTLLMVDRAENTASDGVCANHFVLQTLPCRGASDVDSVFRQLKTMEERLRSPFVARVAFVSRHTFQFFADSGMLVECWPMLFVATEYFAQGSWLQHFRAHYLDDLHSIEQQRPAHAYARMERHVIASFRQVAAGLAAMHSLGVYHLNLTLDNIFVTNLEGAAARGPALKVAGFLACKAAFADEQLRTDAMQQCIRHSIAPPELFEAGVLVPEKADVWMVGCALYAALRLWETQSLGRNGAVGPDSQGDDDVVVRLRTIAEVLQEIPIAASPAVRSLVQTLLEPDPAERPDMRQVLDLLTSTETQRGPAV